MRSGEYVGESRVVVEERPAVPPVPDEVQIAVAYTGLCGIDAPGSLQQKWNVRASLLVGLPAGLSLEQAALAESTAVAVHEVRIGGVQEGDTVVVMVGGPIGVLIAEVALHTGAGTDVVFDVSGAAAAATGLCKARGTLVVVAIHPEPRAVDLKQVFWRELQPTEAFDDLEHGRAMKILVEL